MGTARDSDCGDSRVLYLYGVSGMKDYEVLLYEEFCKRCKKYTYCAWRCISDDTCFEMTAFEERKENGKDDERKETD